MKTIDLTGIDPRRMHTAELHVLHSLGDVVHVRLPRRHCFVLFMRDTQPEVAPDQGPGDYEIDVAELLPGGKLPAAIMAVRKTQAAAFQNMPVEMVNDMLDQALQAERGGHA